VSEDLYFEIQSVAPLHTVDRLASVGRTLDAFAEFVPTRMGRRDPPRTAITTVEEQLVAWAPSIHPGDFFTQLIARSRMSPNAWGTLWIVGDIWNYPPIGPHRFEFAVDEDWFAGPERGDRLERFAQLFRREIESMDAFWGGAGLTSFRRQTNDFVLAAQVDRTLVLPGVPGTGWDIREHALPDLYWLNFFGPAYLELWGRETVEGLCFRWESTANGGIVVWTTPDPFTFDPAARRLTDYAWKRPFYDALGQETILHERWQDPGRGVRVPSYDDHRRLVAGG